MGASATNAIIIRAAKKALKRQESGSMKIKSLAKELAKSISDKKCEGVTSSSPGHTKESIRKSIEESSKFTVDGKLVSLSFGSKRKSIGDTGSDTVANKKKKKEKGTPAPLEQPTTTPPAAPTDVAWTSFRDAPFAPPVHAVFAAEGFLDPSPIQSRAWPVALLGKDLIAVAKTGSGKTLGFLLPMFHRISVGDLPGGAAATGASATPAPLGLVISPTRELAIQIHGVAATYGAAVGLASACVYGGTNVQAQTKQLRTAAPQVVIATPGRLCDLMEREALSLARCHFLVLDEADRMLDMGFEPQLKQVKKALPDKARLQTLFFTATWPNNVRRVAATFLRPSDTVEIFIGEEGANNGELAANKAVTQTFIAAQDDEKDQRLYKFLLTLDAAASVVIFANTKRRVDYIADAFWNQGFSTCAVHGDKAQTERDASLKSFVGKECQILVATDVAARGLDIKGVTHVINFDMARDVESYVHRIGRTGRAGEVGEAITFWNRDYDIECSPALVKIARNAGQVVPDFLQKYEKTKASKQWKVAAAEKLVATIL
mmetsp:Transcript_4724/g.9960  ORF Transcript_4724/g.9960 Transcript_4724/m.9960 type:complete len:547 (+) Transcript_4724:111-1751(+)